ncbi:MAG: hypothetical protein DLM50_03230 [Candidatus Meridianibacter frigidus]|nr:MAG: hypothetical protein DLM50_03230 [Candidatus Eremiobacteraeota bacterium]
MRHILVASAALALLAAAPAKPPNAITITVNGEGAISKAPDTAAVTASIQTNADTAQSAAEDNNGRYNDMRNKLHAIGVSDDQIRTTSYNVNYVQPQPEPPGGPTTAGPVPGPYYGPHPGFNVTRDVQITTKDLNAVGTIIDQALSARVTNIYGVGYTNSQERTLHAQALKMAVADAQQQAQAMAEAAHLRIVRVQSLQSGYYAQPMVMRAMGTAPSPTPQIPTEIAPGNLDVRATVTVTYLLAP